MARPSSALPRLHVADALDAALGGAALHEAVLVHEQDGDRVHHPPAEVEELESFGQCHRHPPFGSSGSGGAPSVTRKSRSAASTSRRSTSAGSIQRTACT